MVSKLKIFLITSSNDHSNSLREKIRIRKNKLNQIDNRMNLKINLTIYKIISTKNQNHHKVTLSVIS